MRRIAPLSQSALFAGGLQADESRRSAIGRATVDDAGAIARLLHDFNREFDEPTPAVETLAQRIAYLLDAGDTVVLLVGDGPEGLAVLRFREAIWSSGLECYLAELYVVPARLGTALVVRSWRHH